MDPGDVGDHLVCIRLSFSWRFGTLELSFHADRRPLQVHFDIHTILSTSRHPDDKEDLFVWLLVCDGRQMHSASWIWHYLSLLTDRWKGQSSRFVRLVFRFNVSLKSPIGDSSAEKGETVLF